MSDYRHAYERSLRDRDAFWAEAAEGISWTRRWDRVIDESRPPFVHWFPGGMLNTCYNAVDRHVERGRGKQRALIYDSPVTGVTQAITYRELQDEVARLAGALRRLGLAKGDRVIIYMPGVPQAIFAMLACARLGAIHSVVFGGFASKELATRIDDAKPKIIMTASCGIEAARVIAYKPLLDRAIDLATHKPDRCLVLQRPQVEASLTAGRDLDWHEALAGAEPAECVPVESTRPALHPLHVGHDGHSERRRPRQRRARRRAEVEHGERVQRRPRRSLLGRIRHRLDRRARLHRLRPAAARGDDDPLRGQAGRHA